MIISTSKHKEDVTSFMNKEQDNEKYSRNQLHPKHPPTNGKSQSKFSLGRTRNFTTIGR